MDLKDPRPLGADTGIRRDEREGIRDGRGEKDERTLKAFKRLTPELDLAVLFQA